MDYNFTGSHHQRSINLGGQQGPTSAQLATQARQHRAQREQARRQQDAALHIQAVLRSRHAQRTLRSQWASDYRTCVGQHGALEPRTAVDDVASLVDATRLLVFSVARPLSFVGRTASRTSRPRRPPAEVAVLAVWCQAVQATTPQGGMLLGAPLGSKYDASWRFLVTAILTQVLVEVEEPKTNARHIEVFLALFAKVLRVPGNKTASAGVSLPEATRLEWASSLLRAGLYASLRRHLIALPVDRKASSTLEPAMDLCLAPLSLYPPAKTQDMGQNSGPTSAPKSEDRRAVLSDFTSNILTIPALPNRIPLPSLTKLVGTLPFAEVTDVILKGGVTAEQTRAYPYLLANYLALGARRVPYMSDGASLCAYLNTLTLLQDALPDSVFVDPATTSSASNAMDIDEEAAEDVAQGKSLPPHTLPKDGAASSATESVDPHTYKWLSTLPSDAHLSSILTVSARFPTSTRPALSRFLCSVLAAWPNEVRDKVLSVITYGYIQTPSSGAAGSAGSGSAGFMVGGFVRELWRGWLRGNKLARKLSTASAGTGAEAALGALSDPASAPEWPHLVLLAELYSRCLLTIGDDEFYPRPVSEATAAGASSSSSQPASSRNPLTLDEVVSLSGLLRNLAFALYWHEGSRAFQAIGGSHGQLPGMRISFLSLRALVTKVLQQLHARDSRRRFTPDSHWLMVSEVDMQAFIQTVILEEKVLSAQAEQDASGADVPMAAASGRAVRSRATMNDDDDDEDDDDGGMVSQTLPGPGRRRTRVSRRIRAHRGRTAGLTAGQLAFLSPRLGVLNNIPFCIPFEVRVEVLRQFIWLDHERQRENPTTFLDRRRIIKVRRGTVAEDGFAQLNPMGAAIKQKLYITFLDQWGEPEAGIDGGGLFKEFLTSLVKEAFDTDRGLWRASDRQEIYPNPHSYAQQPEQLEWYTFLGRVLGKAIYDGILVNVKFASFFLSKWLGHQGYLDDLASLESLDGELYRNLIWLKNYDGDVEHDLALTFAVTDDEFGVSRTTELVPHGSEIAVTRENRLDYIYRMSHYRLTAQIRKQCDAFFAGLSDIVEPKWLRMFNREELREVVSGTEVPIDLEDLRANTVYGGYHEKDEAVEFFWQALASFGDEERRAFLKFVTSCPSPPLLGFSQLNPKLGIRDAGDDDTRLPSSSTCVNLLKLPRYTSAEQCAEKLRYAIQSGAGFDLS